MSYWLPLLLFLLTLCLTWCYLRLCISNAWYDIPNERSAHVTPVPSSAGLVFSTVFFLAATIYYLEGLLGDGIYFSLCLSLAMMLVGFADDFTSLSIRTRLLAQLLLVTTLLLLMDGTSLFYTLGTEYHLGLFAWLIFLLAVMWLINLFNFMDGMDGIAAGEVIFICLSSLFVLGVDVNSTTGLLMITLLSVVGGFFILNFCPAKLFMGDSGSNFLGILLAILIFISTDESVLGFWTWMILLGVFIADSSFTLLRRMIRGAVWYHGHKSHAYQKLMQRFGDQRKVFFLLMLVNVCWILPLAILSMRAPDIAPVLTGITYMPLLYLAYWLKAGCEETVENRA